VEELVPSGNFIGTSTADVRIPLIVRSGNRLALVPGMLDTSLPHRRVDCARHMYCAPLSSLDFQRCHKTIIVSPELSANEKPVEIQRGCHRCVIDKADTLAGIEVSIWD
jgi:hypothetical protein